MGTPVILADRVLVATATTGTGTYQLGAAITGYLDAAAAGVGSGARLAYVVVDSLSAPTAFEIGEGVYTSGSPGTLTRAQIRRNTSGATAAVNWGAGTKYLMLAPSAANLPTLDTAGDLNIPGSVNSSQGGLMPTAALAPYAGSTAPSGWLMCFGQAVSRTSYAALFAALATTYGVGDGSTTFNLPDLRGRTVAGTDNMGGTAANRLTMASGIGGTTLGATGGDQLQQAHGHGVTDPGHTHGIPGGNSAFVNAATFFAYPATGGSGNYIGYGSPTVNSAATGLTVNTAGSGNTQNVQPTIVLNWIIKT